MLRSSMIHGAIALAFAVSVGVASVDDTGPDESAPATASPDESAPDNASPESTPDDSSSADENVAVGPPPGDIDFQVDMMLGLVPEDEMNAYWEDQESGRQVEIQACMNEAGFEYNLETNLSFADPMADLSTLEYAEQWGFGAYTMMDPENNPWNDVDQEYVWPNEEIIDGLSSGERDAWFEVNYQCQNDSYMQNDPYRNPMVRQALDDFYTEVESHPRMQEAAAAWVDCMEEAGHPFASQNDMYDTIYGSDLQEQFYDSEAWETDSADHAEWQSMVELEIGVAVANVGCAPPMDDTRKEVIDELRREFVEVWRTINWSLPPETYPGEGDIFGTAVDGMSIDDSVVDAPAADDSDDSNGAGVPVGLDLSGSPDTTEP